MARELLALSAHEAAEGGLVIAAAHAELALAVIDLRALLDGGGERDQGNVLARFDEITGMFRAGGHVFGDALAQWAVAGLLLEYGNPAGIELARAAAAGFAAADVPSTELQVWSALRLWYLVHGDQAAGREAAARAAQLAPAVGPRFPRARRRGRLRRRHCGGLRRLARQPAACAVGGQRGSPPARCHASAWQ